MAIKMSGLHVMMDVDKIKIVPGFNPPDRTEPEHMRTLLAQIRDMGILIDLVINEEGELVDGHRRLACAKALGIEQVPVHVLKGDVPTLWSIINGTTRTVGGRASMHIASKGAPIINPRDRSRIERLRRILGDSGIVWLAEHRKSASIDTEMQRIMSFLGRDDDDFAAKVVVWLVEHNAQRLTRNAIEAGIPSAILEDAIENDLDLWQPRAAASVTQPEPVLA